ncbi:alpha/beta fold hydrolase [Paradevosia shaoguanensis]|uniref:Alpha/beta hydrolase n=1 Tax=Paradevosia shaoguanensis TaxID=1335043 RepID=A0AA41QLE7_9HYPH|nr:alpha/beta hydrolase [Paradevosia shaoguanensis]MCF1742538.1 alpha/beta hydrolase [Paradevosia shaoguanensis]MCI0127021.1 alpha/beta hydrolase [Paradevosia shaoguanensis]
MKTIHLNGADFVYDIAGEEHEDTIIVLHGGRGIGDHRGDFQAFAPLTDHYRVIAYDQRGCGESSLTPPYTFEQFADDLEAFRQYFLGDRKLILIGGSFGGMIALTYAVKYGDKLSHLILRGTAASHHHEAEAIENFNARIHKATSASIGMVDKMFSDKVVDDTELRLIWLALQPLYFENFDPDAALEKTRTMQLHAETHNALFKDKSYDLLDKLPGIKVPTFVVCGGSDWICPPSQSRIIADTVPGAEYLEVPGANHPVHHEKPEIVLPAIRDFIARRRG